MRISLFGKYPFLKRVVNRWIQEKHLFKITQIEISDVSSVSEVTISHIMSGKSNNPRMSTLQAIDDAVNNIIANRE